MYFDLAPKTKKEDLYGFEGELTELNEKVDAARIILILSPRRTGKTSLLTTFLNEGKRPYVFMDMRKTMVGKRDFMGSFGKGIYDFLARNEKLTSKLRAFLKSVGGVEISTSSVKISWKKGEMPNPVEILEAIDKWAYENKKNFILAIDEAQEMRRIKEIDLLNLLAYAYDHLKNTVICLTGSEIGVMYDFLDMQNTSSPLYGRSVFEMKLKRLDSEKSMDFLRKGFKQKGLDVEKKTIENAVEQLDGALGWLTYYGWNACNKGCSLDKVAEEASRLSLEEVRSFVLNSRSPSRYKLIFEALAPHSLPWNKIKTFLEIEEGKEIDGSNLADLLENLVKFGFVEKEEGVYRIADPVLKNALSKEKL
jgi:AAA+ ATPase superfamily predicted ATPase